MTDNGDPASPRDVASSSDLDKEKSRKATHVAPTDPEVPSAKRRGALRRHRSLVGLAVVVVGLLSITFSLLYRTSQRVGAPNESGGGRSFTGGIRESSVSAPRDPAAKSTLTGLRQPSPLPPRSEVDDEASTVDGASSAGAARSSAPPVKTPRPAIDIIRTPPF